LLGRHERFTPDDAELPRRAMALRYYFLLILFSLYIAH